jgi:ribosomal protein S18 acetylase RimI-like enzyme
MKTEHNITLRVAQTGDLDALVAIENASFHIDRMSRRAFRRFIGVDTAALWVAVSDAVQVVGYVLVIVRANTALARLYSMAVAPDWCGKGIGQMLLDRAEEAALDFGAPILRLEVHPKNAAALHLYRKNGYQEFALYPDYYEDHSDALRMEKVLVAQSLRRPSPLHFYHQTLPFTCGPASLMMAMNALDPAIEMDRSGEIAIWREATTIFMTSGHGGCGPLGLALAAHRRGFKADVLVSHEGPLFADTVRKAKSREVIELVHHDFTNQAHEAGIGIEIGPVSVDEIEARMAQGQMALVLISQYRIYGDKVPHWVVVSGFDDRFVYVTDPDIGEDDEPYNGSDCVSVPILRHEFDLMAKYGRSKLQAAVFIGRQA